MADNLIAPLASTPLQAGARIVLEALDPDTGAAITGVTVSEVVISGVREASGADVFIETGPPRLIAGPTEPAGSGIPEIPSRPI